MTVTTVLHVFGKRVIPEIHGAHRNRNGKEGNINNEKAKARHGTGRGNKQAGMRFMCRTDLEPGETETLAT
jgi:hypothetical protein